MFQSNNYLFNQPEFNTDFKQGANDLATTTHNSPGSNKSKSFTLEDSPFNCSFDQGTQTGHAQAIWDASIKYLQAAVKQWIDTAQGFNNKSFSNIINEKPVLKEEIIEELIMSNFHLTIQQKNEFIKVLESESQLANLMKELSNIFNQSIFQQLTYVIFKIWEKKSRDKSLNKEENQFVLQSFDCFWGYENEEFGKIPYTPLRQKITYDQVLEKANQCSETLCQQIYFNKKINLLNLRESQKQTQDQQKLLSLFNQFFKSVAQSIYLSSEGFYYQSSKEQEIISEIDEDFDFEINSMSALDELKQSKHKFVRSFSQCLENYEEEFDFTCSNNKKRKLQ